MRVPPPVEENQMPGVRPDDRAIPLDRAEVRGRRVMREDEFAARARQLIGTEQQAGQWVRIDMTFESHPGSALNVQDDPVPVIESRFDGFPACSPGHPGKAIPVEAMEPGQTPPHLVSVNPAPGDVRHMFCLAGQDRRPRELTEISAGCDVADVVLPSSGKSAGEVKSCPAETCRHYQTAPENSHA